MPTLVWNMLLASSLANVSALEEQKIKGGNMTMAQRRFFRNRQCANNAPVGAVQILSFLMIFLGAHGYLRVGVPRTPVTVQPGSDALLRCRFSVGYRTVDLSWLVLTWRFQGYEVAKYDEDDEEEGNCNDRALIFVDELRKGNASLLLTNVTAEDSGIYTCSVVYSSYNQVKTLRLEVSGTSIQVLVPHSMIKVQSGSSVMLGCHFTIASETVDTTILLVIWTLNGTEVARYDEVMDENRILNSRANLFCENISNGNASLLLKDIRLQDSGEYMCIIMYNQERQDKKITLDVFEHAFQVAVPHTRVTAQYGSSALLGCQFAVGYETLNPQKLGITWLFQGHELVAHVDFYADEEMTYKATAHLIKEQFVHGNASLLLTDITLADEGNYMCSVFYWPLRESKTIMLKVSAPTASDMERNEVTAPTANDMEKNEVTENSMSQNTANALMLIPFVVISMYLQ
ncbi:CD276 antigen-like isoform X2 [Protopterus annectens]|uniref:CD276 antigen-like isoform X2 n=1 Tax=Protopterus annectens TaxID=7888 RepID=UPI001CFA780D|nr:CD276 antigen-like isoform X2 [Protopterus annectens]